MNNPLDSALWYTPERGAPSLVAVSDDGVMGVMPIAVLTDIARKAYEDMPKDAVMTALPLTDYGFQALYMLVEDEGAMVKVVAELGPSDIPADGAPVLTVYRDVPGYRPDVLYGTSL